MNVLVAATATSFPQLRNRPQSVSLETVEPTTLQTPMVKRLFFFVILRSFMRSKVSPDWVTIKTAALSLGRSTSVNSEASQV